MQLLGRLGLLHSSGDEFSAVSLRFEEIRQSEIRMEGRINQYYNSARNNLLLSLLHGAFAQQVSRESMELFGLPFDQKDQWLYMVMTVVREGEVQDEEIARDLLKLQNDLTMKHVPAVNCIGPENALILIFYSDEEDRVKAVRQLTRLKKQLGEYCGENFSNYGCFCGSPHHGLLGISKSYQEALEDRNRGETGSYTEYYFPLDWEIQLITQLRAGNAEVLERLLRELKRENLARELPTAEHRQLMSILTEMMMRVARETKMDTVDITLRLSAIMDLEDRDTAWEELNLLARDLCPVQGEIEGARTMGERIRQYLHENFRDSGLSQKSIADEFGLTCPNMSRMFKRTTGKNFIDYLQELRVTAAREAFDAGRTDVMGVARECGYENEVTFRRAFFRIFAISPYQYVLQRGSGEGTELQGGEKPEAQH